MTSVREDIEALAFELERFHSVFYKLWEVATIHESKHIPTAGIAWDKKTKTLQLIVNPDFWKSLDLYNKKFVLCHEMSHPLLNHLKRIQKLDLKRANLSTDITINEMLVSSFNFDRDKIANWKNYAWLDTVPFTINKVESEREHEYYYNIIDSEKMKKGGNGKGGGMPGTVDDHSGWEDMSDEDLKDLEKAIDKALSEMEHEEVEDLKNRVKDSSRGTEKMDKVIKVLRHRANQSRWRKIFKHWTLEQEEDVEQWVSRNRRFSLVENTSFILPSEKEKEDKKNKGDVWLFLDTSGSCEALAQDFFDAANSIPRAHFNVRLFGFSTRVYEVKNNQLQDFGGTYFTIIEDYIRQQGTYPAAVFVITDGAGDYVSPKHPDRWYWFLSYNNTSCIPKECRKFNLKDLSPIA